MVFSWVLGSGSRKVETRLMERNGGGVVVWNGKPSAGLTLLQQRLRMGE